MTVRIALLLMAVISLSSSLAQSNNNVDIVPNWAKNETHLVKLKSTTTDNINGKDVSFTSNFDVKFTVQEVSDAGYKVEWIITGCKLAENDPSVENQIVCKLANTKLIIQLSDVGQFKEISNLDKIQPVVKKIVDEAIATGEPNSAVTLQYKAIQPMTNSKQGIEILALKQAKLYFLSFGFNYELNKVQNNKIKFPNPLGGQPYDANEIVKMTKLDAANSMCTIETEKVMDAKNLKASISEHIKRVASTNQQLIQQVENASLEMGEQSMHQINYSKGIVQKAYFRRVTNLGFQNRTTLLEIEAGD